MEVVLRFLYALTFFIPSALVSSFDYSEHLLDNNIPANKEIIRELRELEHPQEIVTLPGFRHLVSDHWNIGEYKGKILKAPAFTQNHITHGMRAQLLVQKMTASGAPQKLKDACAQLLQEYNSDSDYDNSDYDLIHSSFSNINRVCYAEIIREAIMQENAHHMFDVASEKIVQLQPDEGFSDQNCIIVAEKINGSQPRTFTPEQFSALRRIVQKTGHSEVRKKDFIQRSIDNKLIFIDTKNLSEGREELWRSGLVAYYKRWQYYYFKRHKGCLLLTQEINDAVEQEKSLDKKISLLKELCTTNKLTQTYFMAAFPLEITAFLSCIGLVLYMTTYCYKQVVG